MGRRRERNTRNGWGEAGGERALVRVTRATLQRICAPRCVYARSEESEFPGRPWTRTPKVTSHTSTPISRVIVIFSVYACVYFLSLRSTGINRGKKSRCLDTFSPPPHGFFPLVRALFRHTYIVPQTHKHYHEVHDGSKGKRNSQSCARKRQIKENNLTSSENGNHHFTK